MKKKIKKLSPLMDQRNQVIYDKYSRCDALLPSSNTDVIIEYKDRYKSITSFSSVILEKQKYDNIKRLMTLLNAPAFYVVEFLEFVLVYDISPIVQLNWDQIPATISFNNSDLVQKDVAFLPYSDAQYIISKKTWNTGSYDQLKQYLIKDNSIKNILNGKEN